MGYFVCGFFTNHRSLHDKLHDIVIFENISLHTCMSCIC